MRHQTVYPMPSILIAHAEQEVLLAIGAALDAAGYWENTVVSRAGVATDLLSNVDFDLLILGTRLPCPSRCVHSYHWCDVAGPIRGGLKRSPVLPILLVCEEAEFAREARAAEQMEVRLMRLSEVLERPQVVQGLLRPSKTPRVLLVEDDAITAERIRGELEPRFAVEIATTAARGRASWWEQQHDLIVLDLLVGDVSESNILRLAHGYSACFVYFLTDRGSQEAFSTPRAAMPLLGVAGGFSRRSPEKNLLAQCELRFQNRYSWDYAKEP